MYLSFAKLDAKEYIYVCRYVGRYVCTCMYLYLNVHMYVCVFGGGVLLLGICGVYKGESVFNYIITCEWLFLDGLAP